APQRLNTLASLAEVYFAVSGYDDFARTAAEVDQLPAFPDARVVMSALAWATARLTHAPDDARELAPSSTSWSCLSKQSRTRPARSSPISCRHTVPPSMPLHRPIDLALIVGGALGGALVVLLLVGDQGELDLDPGPLEVEPQRDQRVALDQRLG